MNGGWGYDQHRGVVGNKREVVDFIVSCREKDESLQKAVLRILAVWEERRVFEQDLLTKFKTIISKLPNAYTHTHGHSSLCLLISTHLPPHSQ